MKLTEQKLKQLIAEELNSLNELDPFGGAVRDDMPPTDAEKIAQSPDTDKEVDPNAQKQKVQSLSKLGDEFISVGRAIKSSKIKGLDSKEISLISQLMAANFELASAKSAGTLLQRILSLVEKNK